MSFKVKNILVLVLILAVTVWSLFFVYPLAPFADYAKETRPWKLGLDLVGGSYLVYNVDMSQVEATEQESVMSGLRDVIERRVNLFGVAEPQVFSAIEGGQHRLIVNLAGIKEVSAAIEEIGKTPFLEFREVEVDGEGNLMFLETEVTGKYVSGAQVVFDQYTSEPYVVINFTDEGDEAFAELTGNNVGERIAVFIDGEVLPGSIATVQQRISGGSAQITGDFTIQGAQELVQGFNAGALPAPITLVNQQTVSATLGGEALRAAIYAGLAGLVAIMIFMVLYYGWLGVFSAVALVIYTILTLAIFKLVPVTMTLAGIAGFILSVGMAIDANILIFERTREELERGAGKFQAIEDGFKRAWTSIRDSNISTIITAVIMYYLTSSFVRGFALTLLIGVVVSMFSAITVTRTMLRIFMKEKTGQPANSK